ncbi:MAG: GlyGly-CTERM sorting domain-containing protein, partial [Nitrospirae bacterium]|nr:GlyGly-CTERM sorting domain-containing protein [Nitrospirota bacterium]
GRYANFRGFGLKSIANFFGSSNGTTEIRLAEIDYGAINPTRLAEGIVPQIPDRVFNLAGIDPVDPPRYLARCAVLTATELANIDLLNPPLALLNCLKQDLSEFLIENSFNHQVDANVPPLYIVHGTDDTLVPYAQTINLCNARDAGTRPVDVAAPGVMYRCGTSDEVHVISGAQHTLDLGFCFGTLCPAGAPASGTRQEVFATLTSAYQWAGMEAVQPSNVTTANTAPMSKRAGGGGALSLISILIALVCGGTKRKLSLQ